MSFDITLVQRDSGGMLPAELQRRVEALCVAEGIPPEGITIMGGKPYVNVTGLDNKVRRRAEAEGLVFSGCTVEEVAVKEADRREFKATVTYFNQVAFAEAVKGLGAQATCEAVNALREAFTYRYSDVGSCSMKTAKMSTMQNADNIAMLASRRASNRAKRAATGVGLTSIDEVMGEPQGKGSREVILRPEAKVSALPAPAASKAEPPTDPIDEALSDSDNALGREPEEEAPAPAVQPPAPSACISEKQRGRLYAILQKGATSADVRNSRTAAITHWMQSNLGHAESRMISRNDYEKVCAEAARIAAE